MLKRFAISLVPLLLAAGAANPAAAQDAKRAFDIGEQQRKDKRYEEAQLSYDAACRGGYAEACFKLGNSYEHGWGDIAKNAAKAEEHYMRGCNLGQRKSCAGAAITLDDRPETAPQALRYNVAACDEEAIHWACTNAGAAYKNGTGTAVNKDEAQRYYATACDLGSGTGCFWQARLLQAGGSVAELRRAEALYKRHCDTMKGKESCERYGALVYNRSVIESRTRTPSDSATATAARYFTIGCERGRKSVCRKAAQFQSSAYHNVRRSGSTTSAQQEAARKLIKAYGLADCAPNGCGHNTYPNFRRAKLDLVATDYSPQSDPCRILGNISLSAGATADFNMLNRKAKCIGRYHEEEAKRLQAYFADTGITITTARENGGSYIRWTCPAQSGCTPKLKSMTDRVAAKLTAMRNAMKNNLNRYAKIYKRSIEVTYY